MKLACKTHLAPVKIQVVWIIFQTKNPTGLDDFRYLLPGVHQFGPFGQDFTPPLPDQSGLCLLYPELNADMCLLTGSEGIGDQSMDLTAMIFSVSSKNLLSNNQKSNGQKKVL